MSITQTFLIGATDLSNYGALITDWGPGFDAAPRRGQNYVLPGADGETYVAKPLAAYDMPIGVTLTSADPSTGVVPATDALQAAQVKANYDSLVSLVAAVSGGTFTMTRRTPNLSGTYTDQTCTAEVTGGITASPLSHGVIRVVIHFRNLSGKWT